MYYRLSPYYLVLKTWYLKFSLISIIIVYCNNNPHFIENITEFSTKIIKKS